MTSPTVRPIAEDEFGAFVDVVRTAFLSPPMSDEAVAARRARSDIGRCLAAFDGDGRLCGAARSFATPLTVPGGEVTAGAVSSVGVLPTHTRQGHLTRLMRTQLTDARDRGEPVTILIAAEYPIYGRFGYGPAIEATTLRIDARTAAWRDALTGSVEIVDAETWAKLASELYGQVRRVTPGHIGWDLDAWRATAGADPLHNGGDEARRHATKVVWRDGTGEPRGAVTYQVDESWVHNRPANALRADGLVASTARAEHELLRYLSTIDWVAEVSVSLRPVDDPAPLALVDGRTARLEDRSDNVWLRVLDPRAALAARRYAAPGRLVVEIDDPLGFASGRFRLDAGPEGAECAPTTDAPDLAAPVGALGAAYLGGQSWSRLAAAGWVDERRPGGLARADALFAVPRAPWNAVTF